jgi:hypothetical protein
MGILDLCPWINLIMWKQSVEIGGKEVQSTNLVDVYPERTVTVLSCDF